MKLVECQNQLCSSEVKHQKYIHNQTIDILSVGKYFKGEGVPENIR